ncbi:hypothetical protein ccbrp13_44090 [Ktedonobacteria bacterium brp13]|nr:hypothetical protein ccbrp13_44090 [Ktedonobacteria bacterium brp13]
MVQVCERHGMLSVWSRGELMAQLAKRSRSQECVTHPDQFRTVAAASAMRQQVIPLGHLRPAPQVSQRPLQEYDQLYGVGFAKEVVACGTSSNS